MKLHILLFALLHCFALTAWGQTYPSKPIRLLVGYPPGGSGDFLTRVIGDELSKDLGVSVIVENKPGAGAGKAGAGVGRESRVVVQP